MSTITSSLHLPDNKYRGPHPGILAIVYMLLFIVSLISFKILTQGAEYPRPFGSTALAQDVFLKFPDAIRINAFFQFASAIPLGLFAAASTSRLASLGVRVAGINIAFFGGIAASVLFMLSGLCSWILSQPGIADDLNLMHAIQIMGFGCGGVAFTAALGLLMAGISLPCLLGNYSPKWLAWLGMILAGLAELSTLGLVFPRATWLLPIVRFPSFVWMIGMGFSLIRFVPSASDSVKKNL